MITEWLNEIHEKSMKNVLQNKWMNEVANKWIDKWSINGWMNKCRLTDKRNELSWFLGGK